MFFVAPSQWSEIPDVHTFRTVFSVGRLQVCLVAFSIACAVAGARHGGSEEGTPTILYVIFLIILLVLQTGNVSSPVSVFSFSCVHWNISGS